ncbi:MAG: TIGR02449 family protein [Gammaproteobacteria bacterium]|nr:TIGR02449 family protein [Gammaproteobacteria bacterium]
MDSNNKTYTESDLQKLENQIDALIDAVNQLKQENTSLRHQQDNLLAERSQLIEKTELARNRVEAMITRLRSLELSS